MATLSAVQQQEGLRRDCHADFVYVRAWKLGDGTFLATEVKVKPAPAPTFFGVIVGYFPEQFTICVKVSGHSGAQDGPCIGFGSDVKTVCYEFADVVGELAVGKIVDIYKDHLEGNTYLPTRSWSISLLAKPRGPGDGAGLRGRTPRAA